jgi:hypothetical protein
LHHQKIPLLLKQSLLLCNVRDLPCFSFTKYLPNW